MVEAEQVGDRQVATFVNEVRDQGSSRADHPAGSGSTYPAKDRGAM